MKKTEFDEFISFAVKRKILTKRSAQSYKTYLNNADQILKGGLETSNFIQNENYLNDIIQFISEARKTKKEISNIKSALYKFADFAIAKHHPIGKATPKHFITKWLQYAKASEAIKNELNWTSNITGDFGEFLIADVFGYIKARNSEETIDLEDKDGKTYQVKTRKVTKNNMTTSLGICRKLTFDYLISVLLAPNGTILKILKHDRHKLKQFIPNAKNSHQRGFVFVTTEGFRKAGEDSEMLADVLQKYPELKP